MNASVYIIPALIVILLVFARFRGVKAYDSFVAGAKEAVPLALSVFPYLAAVFAMTELFERSGLADALVGFLSPALEAVGVPPVLGKLMLIKPFSGSGSLAVLSEVYATYGPDSYIARCASVIFGSSETVFYISAVYFAGCKNKKLTAAVIISLVSTLLSALIACLLCRIM